MTNSRARLRRLALLAALALLGMPVPALAARPPRPPLYWYCSRCGYQTAYAEWHGKHMYCPRCGTGTEMELTTYLHTEKAIRRASPQQLPLLLTVGGVAAVGLAVLVFRRFRRPPPPTENGGPA